ncbi:MAG TPA: hypothetical protein VKX49_12570 [Bryobacteraceae bacterium]|nr:hypothetical protein [Bryobacteraceae bacterium]
MSEEDHRQMYLLLNARVTELSFRLYAVQSLLQEQGIVADADVERRISELKQLWEDRLEQHLADQIEKEKLEALRRLLESHDGPPQ